ncbi:hypothetical protein [Aquisphaera insulae]|uniref:hypothetical protein n=1 Tax=Aquisphaera insulae TaxID=2712864 RepID=UPI0013EDD32F|nr:hypothetical protein [Aquisphaera insulae]
MLPTPTTDSGPARDSHRARHPALGRFLLGLRDWVILAWVIVWSWAYVQTALAQRFPGLLGWTRRLW